MTSQFQMLSILAREIQEMKVQLGQLVADFAGRQELNGELVSILQVPCRICCASGWYVEGENVEEKSTTSKYESQLP